jgi:hypothetical protein
LFLETGGRGLFFSLFLVWALAIQFEELDRGQLDQIGGREINFYRKKTFSSFRIPGTTLDANMSQASIVLITPVLLASKILAGSFITPSYSKGEKIGARTPLPFSPL